MATTQSVRHPASTRRGELSPKERMAIKRLTMPVQDPLLRTSNFDEVALGLNSEQAIHEAQRCLQCKNRPCVGGCPVGVRIPDFIAAVAQEDFATAAIMLRDDNTLPATTARVCPQESQCEGACTRGKTGEPVAIGWLQRFVADWGAGHLPPEKPPAQISDFRVAVIGAGPAGLSVAHELALAGHEVRIHEALPDTGGALRYGIPEFRLPKRIVDREVESLRALGVEIKCNACVGRTISLQVIAAGYDATFIGGGAEVPMFVNLPGEHLDGVYCANEYLHGAGLLSGRTRESIVEPIVPGEAVVVLGGGNVAMDAVRTARRLGAKRAVVAYRRSRAEMPVRHEEIAHAEQEQVEFVFLAAPVAIVGDAHDRVCGVRLQRMKLGEPDESGRRRPVPIRNSTFEVPCDTVVMAIGTIADPLLTAALPGLELDSRGQIEVGEDRATSLPGIYAGGDIVRGAGTVIRAMGDGKVAARSIDAYLENKGHATAQMAAAAALAASRRG
jgi:glutamate synthase (NADPH) small chain